MALKASSRPRLLSTRLPAQEAAVKSRTRARFSRRARAAVEERRQDVSGPCAPQRESCQQHAQAAPVRAAVVGNRQVPDDAGPSDYEARLQHLRLPRARLAKVAFRPRTGTQTVEVGCLEEEEEEREKRFFARYG